MAVWGHVTSSVSNKYDGKQICDYELRAARKLEPDTVSEFVDMFDKLGNLRRDAWK